MSFCIPSSEFMGMFDLQLEGDTVRVNGFDPALSGTFPYCVKDSNRLEAKCERCEQKERHVKVVLHPAKQIVQFFLCPERGALMDFISPLKGDSPYYAQTATFMKLRVLS